MKDVTHERAREWMNSDQDLSLEETIACATHFESCQECEEWYYSPDRPGSRFNTWISPENRPRWTIESERRLLRRVDQMEAAAAERASRRVAQRRRLALGIVAAAAAIAAVALVILQLMPSDSGQPTFEPVAKQTSPGKAPATEQGVVVGPAADDLADLRKDTETVQLLMNLSAGIAPQVPLRPIPKVGALSANIAETPACT